MKKFVGIFLAICMMASATGCGSSSDKEVDPLDKVYVFGDDEVTCRKLFEGSEETIGYAKYLNVMGTYDYTYSLSIGSGKGNDDARRTETATGTLEYECFRDENGNASSKLNGGVTYAQRVTAGNMKKAGTDTDSQARFFYYKTFDTQYVKDAYVYYGDFNICGPIDVEKILLPEIESISVVEFERNGDAYSVHVSGNPSPIRSAFNANLMGRFLISDIYYEFKCESHALTKVTLSGIELKEEQEDAATVKSEKEDFNVVLYISELSNKNDIEVPEMPATITQNGYVNDIVLNDMELELNEDIINPFNIQNEFYSVADNIWADVMEMPEKDRNTISELKTAIENAASTYEIDGVQCEYAVLGSYSANSQSDGVLIRYALSSNGETEGYIVVPIACGKNGATVSETLAVDVSDEGKYGLSKGMMFVHNNTPDCQMIANYGLTDSGNLVRQYTEIRESKISNLKDQAERMYFPEEDWDTLQKIASDIDAYKDCSISLYTVREIDEFAEDEYADLFEGGKPPYDWGYGTYYITETDTGADIVNRYSIWHAETKSFMKAVLKRFNHTEEEKSVKWVQILDE